MQKYIKTFTDYYDIGPDDYVMCQYCGNERMIEVHHLKARGQCGSDNIDNLIGVCRTCHNKAHKHKEFNEELKQHKLLNDPF